LSRQQLGKPRICSRTSNALASRALPLHTKPGEIPR